MMVQLFECRLEFKKLLFKTKRKVLLKKMYMQTVANSCVLSNQECF